MPAKSKKQQRFMGMVHAYQKGELDDAPASIKKAAGSMTKKAAKDFAKTKHKGLPEKVTEREKQKVYLSKTQSGRPGLFTKGFLAWPLEPEEATPEKAREIAQRAGFEFEDGYVGEGLKSMTFKEYLQLQEGILDFARGARQAVSNVHQQGKQITAQKQLQTMVMQLAKVLKAIPQTAAPQTATPQAVAQKQAPQAQQQQQQQRNIGGVAPAFQTRGGKPVAHRTKSGETLALASLRLKGFLLQEGPLDFARGATKAAVQGVGQHIEQQQTAHMSRSPLGAAVMGLGKNIAAGWDAHKKAKAKKQQAQQAKELDPKALQDQATALAQNIVAAVAKMQDGQQTLKRILAALQAQDKQAHARVVQALQQVSSQRAGA